MQKIHTINLYNNIIGIRIRNVYSGSIRDYVQYVIIRHIYILPPSVSSLYPISASLANSSWILGRSNYKNNHKSRTGYRSISF